jgi:hypothetical protein
VGDESLSCLRRLDNPSLIQQMGKHLLVVSAKPSLKSCLNAVSVNMVLIGANLPIAPVVRPKVLAALQEPQAD